MAHAVTWISISVLVLAFIFFIVSVIILEFGVGVDSDGDIAIPWYYWLFFVGAGVLFLTFVILQVIVPRDKKKEETGAQMDAWVENNRLYVDGGKVSYPIPGEGQPDPHNIRQIAQRVPHRHVQSQQMGFGGPTQSFASNEPSPRAKMSTLGRSHSYLE